MSTKQYIFIVFIVAISILASFYSGLFLKQLFLSENTFEAASQVSEFKPTFVDEITIVSKKQPYQTLRLSVFRIFKSEKIYRYIVKAFYFDGQKWTKDYAVGESPELYTIPKTSIVPNWEINSDPSYMLKESSRGEVKVNGHNISFETRDFYNEMAIRSSPKYTKFMSDTNAVLVIDGVKYDSHALYNKVYSFNEPESLIYTDDPTGIETEWLAFWDTEGNFYSIDDTTIDNKRTVDSYKAHSMAVEKNKEGYITKSFTLDLKKDSTSKYIVDIGENINKSISVTKINSINNSINDSDPWSIGQVIGTVTTKDGKKINGYGFFEEISQ